MPTGIEPLPVAIPLPLLPELPDEPELELEPDELPLELPPLSELVISPSGMKTVSPTASLESLCKLL